MVLTHMVSAAESGRTVKFILKGSMGLSERLVKKLKYAGRILRNCQPVHVNVPVSAGDLIEIHIDFEDANEEIIPQDIPIDILFEDDSLIAVNKQPGIVVHPTGSHPSGTIANAIMYHFIHQDIRTRIRPVSRLDRDTSGIILFAKNAFIQENLIRQMAVKTFSKEYIGIAEGIFTQKEGTIDLPIDRKPGSIMLRHINPEGAASITHYKVLRQMKTAALLQFDLETGRTHQIRVHCQAIGHPLVGDTLYPSLESPSSPLQDVPEQDKSDTPPIARQALHSSRTVFLHPLDHTSLELYAPLPADMRHALEILEK